MGKEYAIILFNGEEHLCRHEDGSYSDVSYPMMTFTEGKDSFRVIRTETDTPERTFRYHGKALRLVPGFYPNGWPALMLETPDDGGTYTVLTVNLEECPASGIPDRAFVDVNNNPEAMEFLIRNNLAEDTGYRRMSGWVEYPMVRLNLPELYRISPEAFGRGQTTGKETTTES
ncbi:MAG: DUF4313 domain-containing protein [Bacteroidetes bacterium]|uniref:DUF4313 domain-containing protein n=1 Tax=Candidatus Cryptobacteroides merdavium TaxID=2840769 RepID=A0A9D9ECW5_9BACT|nr:DUF4313 domain-containing protein [Candidatus Cryptobacteroides merdavium]